MLNAEYRSKRLVLIRHGKSSWSAPDLDDFHRPLSQRGKHDVPAMAKRLAAAGIRPDLIVASPAVRAKKTARFMAEETGYDKDAIQYDDKLYLGSLSFHCRLIATLFQQVDVLFLVGHNYTLTELAEHLCGCALGNIPTCGVVALEYLGEEGFSDRPGGGKLGFFWFPKDQGEGNR
jgi:phosphohistidine phosphatase